MAERNGSGYRERVQFDEPLWHEVEALSDHLRLKPADVIRMLTAIGIAQMKGLTMMGNLRAAVEPVVKAEMTSEADRLLNSGPGAAGGGRGASGSVESAGESHQAGGSGGSRRFRLDLPLSPMPGS